MGLPPWGVKPMRAQKLGSASECPGRKTGNRVLNLGRVPPGFSTPPPARFVPICNLGIMRRHSQPHGRTLALCDADTDSDTAILAGVVEEDKCV